MMNFSDIFTNISSQLQKIYRCKSMLKHSVIFYFGVRSRSMLLRRDFYGFYSIFCEKKLHNLVCLVILHCIHDFVSAWGRESLKTCFHVSSLSLCILHRFPNFVFRNIYWNQPIRQKYFCLSLSATFFSSSNKREFSEDNIW